MTKPIITKNMISGNNTRNQEIPLCPSLQIRFKIQVQNKM